MLYATTWYAYLRESNFRVSRRTGLGLLLRLMCLVGFVPTALGVIGLGRVLGGLREIGRVPELPEREYVALGRRVTAVGLFFATLGIVIVAGVRYDVWSCFQGRLLFPVLFAGLLLMAGGLDGVMTWRPASRRWLNAAFVVAYVAWGCYYVAAVASVVRGA
jgi:hypothetical protein